MTTPRGMTVGEALVAGLRARGVDRVFGIPGVHTIALYRGLAGSGIHHVTPRHEQGAGFMADGYARATGRPGVAFVITGPGLTNILTPMAQARGDSIPMLVVSSTLARRDLGRGRGALHELPDQRATLATVAVDTQTLFDPANLAEALDRAWAAAQRGRRIWTCLSMCSVCPADPCRPPARFPLPLRPQTAHCARRRHGWGRHDGPSFWQAGAQDGPKHR
ncbi:thiamine pyrophosphate-binding protein [Rubellimicrobium thermophilum]|nr:thiamine pyrophosphate-binding protein [Rubellimicrobium thermophilum]